MKWLFLALCHVLAQPSLPLLPSGVTIDMVTQIKVTVVGSVNFVKSVDNSSTITSRLSKPLVMTFDNVTGILTISNPVVNDSSSLKPGLVGMFLAVVLAAFSSSNKQHTGILLCLSLGLGVTVTGLVVADVTIRVPGCFHTEGANGATLVFDHECLAFSTAVFQAPPQPVMANKPNLHWKPITPNTSFLPANDHGQHYLDPSVQYEVWRNNFGKAYNETERDNFFAFTEACRVQNLDKDRSWTAACNQFAGMDHATWKSTILADNAAAIAAGHDAFLGRRRLLSEPEPLDLFQQMDEGSRRQLLQEDSFSWVGTGRLTPVKDQGQCGSCYAHGSSSQMEAQLAIKSNTQPRELSREQLKECSQGSPSCNGGYIGNMYTYAANANGLGSEADYPYQASYDGCKSSGVPLSYKNNGYTFIAKNELAFKAAVKNAPIAIGVCADTWNNYMGGIFTGCAQSSCVNHVVMLVGYGVDAGQKYWLFQNSWATWWGEAGFMRVPRTDSSSAQVGACGMTIYEGFQANNPSGVGGPTPAPPTQAAPTQAAPTRPAPTQAAPTPMTPTPVPPTDCQGIWGPWSECTASCNGGTQSRTWQIVAQPTNGGAECPADQVQACNNVVCPGAPPADCLHISNSNLGATGDGNYVKIENFNQPWCLPPDSPAENPQYSFTNADGQTFFLYWWATNCQTTNINGVVTYDRPYGVWGLSDATDGSAYQWSRGQQSVNGVVPDPTTATDAYSFNVQFSACS